MSVIALFLFSRAKESKSVSSVHLASAALRWLHSFVPDAAPNPLDSPFCRNIIEAAKRTYSKPIQKKQPVSADLIKRLIDKFGRSNSNLKDLRVAAMCALGFAGFFRYNAIYKQIISNGTKIISKYWFQEAKRTFTVKVNSSTFRK